MKALTRSEIDSLLELANIQERAMILVSYSHGMRASETIKLLRSDVDMKRRIITVRRLKGSLTSQQPLGDTEYEALGIWLSVAPESIWCFPKPNGDHYSRMTWHRWFKSLCADAGIEDKSLHGLKHATGYALAEANVTLPIIQAHLGHKSASSTFIYAKPSPETVGKIVKAVLETRQDLRRNQVHAELNI